MTLSVMTCRDLQVRRASGFVLNVPRLVLDAGSVTAVCGPNGSGKSTLLLACAGLCDLSAGRVDLGDDPHHQGGAPAPAHSRQQVVLVPQEPYLLRGSVSRNLAWGLRLRRVPRAEQRAATAAVLATLGIEELAQRDAQRLSGGQRTLVAVARALVLHPTVLLLDEVARDLDQRHRQAVVAAIQERARRPGGATLLATHDQQLVAQLADQRVHLLDGQIDTRRHT